MSNKKNRIEYLEAAEKVERYRLVVVGQDPYPKAANGIAFCKNTFDEFFYSYCCGKEVLYSLGYSKEAVVSKNENPLELFYDLLAQGIAFVNVSSVLLDDATDVKLSADKVYNENFLSKTDHIVVLGKSKATKLFKQYYPNHTISESLIHPSGLARKNDPEGWCNTWNKFYLKTTYMPIFNTKLNTMELDKYFNVDIPSTQLYSKGATVRGVHGIELISGEYFASHFHLKTKIAKAGLKQFIGNTSPKELYAKALKENSDFQNWPEVKYQGDNYSIKKYKFSWLMNCINKIEG
jgi:hypothetical protein